MMAGLPEAQPVWQAVAWQLFGRAHLLMVHFPIVLLVVVLLLRVWPRRPRPRGKEPPATEAEPARRTWPRAYGWLVLAALAAVATAGSGWVYAEEFAATEQLAWHRWAGVVTAVVAVLAVLLGLIVRWTARIGWALNTSVLLAVLGVAATGHFGGELVHGEGFLLGPLDQLTSERGSEPPERATKPAGAGGAQPAARPTGAPSDPGGEDASRPDPPALPATNDTDGASTGSASTGPAAAAIDFDGALVPLFDARCLRCHSETAARGDVRLHERAAVLEQVTPGDPDASLLVEVLELPESDPRHMPKNRPSLPPEEIALIRAWIAQLPPEIGLDDEGAPAADAQAAPHSGAVDASDAPDASRRRRPPPVMPQEPPATHLTDEQRRERDAILATLRAEHVAANVLSAQTDWVEVRVLEGRPSFGDDDLGRLAGLEPSLRVLDLTGTAVTDAGMQRLADFAHLRHVRLGRTGVSDAGVAALRPLADLETLDLHRTDVTVAGLRGLSGMPALRTIYAWGTGVTAEDLDGLRAALPDVTVHID